MQNETEQICTFVLPIRQKGTYDSGTWIHWQKIADLVIARNAVTKQSHDIDTL